MTRILEKALVLFLVGFIVALSLIITGFLDYTGFMNLRQYIPKAIANRPVVAQYIAAAEISSKAPKDQRMILLEDKEKYVEELLKKMKVESMKLLDEKQKLESLFRVLEEEKLSFSREKTDYADKVAKYEAERKSREDAEFQSRLDNLAAMYSKMEPKAAADILRDLSVELSKDVLKRLKPKSLGAILEELPPDTRTRIVEMLQQPAVTDVPDFIQSGT
ncbi:MAG: hypothetical protein H3C47_00600 [Candidatus Cloacimonetes bacterium]|nr:hypothetical protein [Candidatus Cloacimonadota bacterium]